jgi:hypothetical protein
MQNLPLLGCRGGAEGGWRWSRGVELGHCGPLGLVAGEPEDWHTWGWLWLLCLLHVHLCGSC